MTQLYPIQPQEFAVESREQTVGGIQYTLQPLSGETFCPLCDSKNILKNGMRDRFVRDLPEYGSHVGLRIHVQRYRCKDCGNIWTQTFKSINDRSKMTIRMRDFIAQRALWNPFDRIAGELSLSHTTIKNAFLEYVDQLEENYDLHAPKVLGIDENHLGGQYRAIFTDINNRLILDILPKRNKDMVKAWLESLPDKNNVACVTMDMWAPYRDAVREVLPKVPIVIDKFHVIKELNRALEQIRRNLRADMSKQERSHLRREKYLLLCNAEDLSIEKQDMLYDLFDRYPMFQKPHALKEQFRDIYLLSKTRADAERKYYLWVTEAQEIPEYQYLINAIENWHEEIFSYFDHRYTNAVSETLNNLINQISQRGRGYSFDVLRAKVLFGTKATKPPKFQFKKEPAPTPAMGYTRPGGHVPHIPQGQPARKQILVHGSGVSIDALEKVIQSGDF